jgi:hypothetical protein
MLFRWVCVAPHGSYSPGDLWPDNGTTPPRFAFAPIGEGPGELPPKPVLANPLREDFRGPAPVPDYSSDEAARATREAFRKWRESSPPLHATVPVYAPEQQTDVAPVTPEGAGFTPSPAPEGPTKPTVLDGLLNLEARLEKAGGNEDSLTILRALIAAEIVK